MRILFDDEIFFQQRFGGVSRIFAELISYIKHYHTKDELQFNCEYTENEYLLKIMPDINSFLKSYNFPFKGKLIRGIYGRYSHSKTNSLIRSNSIDIFHPTFYANYYLNSLPFSKTKLVFTVHDLIHEQSQNENYQKIASIKSQNIKVADQIIVVSEYTKKDLLRLYPFVDNDNIHVIPLSQSLPDIGIKPKSIPDKYLLFTGERAGYKNFTLLLYAFAEMHKEYNNLHLFATGGRPFTTNELNQINKLGVKGFVHQAQLSDSELRYAYQNAELFVFPSLYEGFGIPILEAFSARTPAILSNTTSLPEVGGEAALYMNPKDVKEMIDKIKLLLSDQDLRNSLINMGSERVKKYSWTKNAKQTMAVYEKALYENSAHR